MNSIIKDYYNSRSSRYDQSKTLKSEKNNMLFEKLLKSMSVCFDNICDVNNWIDLCCGTGRYSIPLIDAYSNKFNNYYGIDLSENMLKIFENNIKSDKSNIITLIEGDIYNKSPIENVGLLTSFSSWHYISKPQQIIEQISWTNKTDYIMIMDTVAHEDDSELVFDSLEKTFHPYIFKRWKASEIDELLTHYNFTKAYSETWAYKKDIKQKFEDREEFSDRINTKQIAQLLSSKAMKDLYNVVDMTIDQYCYLGFFVRNKN